MLKTFSTILIAGLATTAAYAQDDQSAQTSQRISYGDLDLTRPAGVAALDRRIATAMTRVCGRKALGSPLVEHSKGVNCHREAMANVDAQRHAVIAAARRGTVQIDSALHLR